MRYAASEVVDINTRGVDTSLSIVYSEVISGGVAQLVERLNGIQEARGSIPLTSKNNFCTAGIIFNDR